LLVARERMGRVVRSMGFDHMTGSSSASVPPLAFATHATAVFQQSRALQPSPATPDVSRHMRMVALQGFREQGWSRCFSARVTSPWSHGAPWWWPRRRSGLLPVCAGIGLRRVWKG